MQIRDDFHWFTTFKHLGHGIVTELRIYYRVKRKGRWYPLIMIITNSFFDYKYIRECENYESMIEQTVADFLFGDLFK